MKWNPLYGALTLPIMIVLGATASRAATTVVKAELQDPGGIKLDHDSIPAGEVRFEATNESKDHVHEMIVVKSDQDPSTFPYDTKKDRVIEAKVKSLGEVSELKPGKSGKLTVNLKPGSYVLYCNQKGHLHQGMWTRLTVTP